MLEKRALTCTALLAALMIPSCSSRGGSADAHPPSRVLQAKLRQHVSVEIPFDARELPPWSRAVLRTLVAAVNPLERAYWEQASPGAWARWQALRASTAPDDVRRARLMQLHGGRFDRFQEMEPFDGHLPRSPGAGFYPPFLTRDELRKHLAADPAARSALLSPWAVIRRSGDGLHAVPYHLHYPGPARQTAADLRRAAVQATDPGLSGYLEGLAIALEADAAPPDRGGLSGSLVLLTAGASPVDDDRLLGIKRAYSAIVGARDGEATRFMARLEPDLASLEEGMPFPAFLRRWSGPASVEVAVGREIRRAGSAAHGDLAAISVQEGTGGVSIILWSTVLEARLEPVLNPIVERALGEGASIGVADCLVATFARGVGQVLGPRGPEPELGRSPFLALVETAKADAASLLTLQWLEREGRLSDGEARRAHDAWLADLLRILRIGDGTRAQAAAVALNWHHERGGVANDPTTHRWRVETAGIVSSASELTRDLVQILAAGDEERARRLVHTYGPLGSHVRATLALLDEFPREVDPVVTVVWE